MKAFKFNSYGAGYRAGMAGAGYLKNPNRNLVKRILWEFGRIEGAAVLARYSKAKNKFNYLLELTTFKGKTN